VLKIDPSQADVVQRIDRFFKAGLTPERDASRRTTGSVTAAASQMPPPGLHPNMAVIFEQKIRALAAALAHEDIEERGPARTTVRGFIDQIVIPPEMRSCRWLGIWGRC
jgi:hypothetical protein